MAIRGSELTIAVTTESFAPPRSARAGPGRPHVGRLRDRARVHVPGGVHPSSRRRRPARGHRLRPLVRDVPGDRVRAGDPPPGELDRVADARDRDVLRADGAPHIGRRIPALLGRSGNRPRAGRVRFAELGPDRGAARHVPPPAVPGRASALAAVAMVRVGARGRARGDLPLDPARSGSDVGVDRSDGAEPARDRGPPPVPERYAGPDPRDPHRGDRIACRAGPSFPAVERSRAAPAAVAAHRRGHRRVALRRSDDRVDPVLLGRRGRTGLDHGSPEHRDPVVHVDPDRDRRARSCDTGCSTSTS